MPDPLLPAGYTTRPAIMEDVDAAVELFNTCSQHLLGRSMVDANYLRQDWATPTFSLETDTICIFSETGDLVGYGEVWDAAPHIVLWSFERVHPDYRERGLENFLIDWEEKRARTAITQAPPDARVTLRHVLHDEAKNSQALFESHGYEVVRHFHKMMIELTQTPPQPVFPKSITVRGFNRAEDLPAVIRADQDAFRDHWGFVQRPFDEELASWGQMIDDDPHFDPHLWYLAMDGDEIAGLCLCKSKATEDPDMGWIRVLAVRRPWRRQGLGLALLQLAFGGLYRKGRKRAGLSVDADSLTGATRLYEKAGMHIHTTTHTYQKELRAGKELSTQKIEES